MLRSWWFVETKVLKTAVRTSKFAGKKNVTLLRSVLCYCEVCYVTAKCACYCKVRYVTAKCVMLLRRVLLLWSVLCYCEVCYVTAKCVTLLRSVLCYCKCVERLRSVLCYFEVCYVPAKCVMLLRSVLCYCEVCYVTAKRAMQPRSESLRLYKMGERIMSMRYWWHNTGYFVWTSTMTNTTT